MERNGKVTVCFSPAVYERLRGLAAARGVSVAELVRSACMRQYGIATPEERIEAVRALSAFRPPVGEPGEMKLESFPSAETLAP